MASYTKRVTQNAILLFFAIKIQLLSKDVCCIFFCVKTSRGARPTPFLYLTIHTPTGSDVPIYLKFALSDIPLQKTSILTDFV